MRAAKRSDELWIGVKGQSNSAISGSLRNSFRAGLAPLAHGGRALIACGPLPGHQRQSNSEYRAAVPRESDCGGQAPWSRGKQPGPPAKVPNAGLSGNKDVGPRRQPGCWLRGSHHLKSA